MQELVGWNHFLRLGQIFLDNVSEFQYQVKRRKIACDQLHQRALKTTKRVVEIRECLTIRECNRLIPSLVHLFLKQKLTLDGSVSAMTLLRVRNRCVVLFHLDLLVASFKCQKFTREEIKSTLSVLAKNSKVSRGARKRVTKLLPKEEVIIIPSSVWLATCRTHSSQQSSQPSIQRRKAMSLKKSQLESRPIQDYFPFAEYIKKFYSLSHRGQ